MNADEVMDQLDQARESRRLKALNAEMLEALRQIEADILPEFLRDHPGSYQAIGSLCAAITRAEGR